MSSRYSFDMRIFGFVLIIIIVFVLGFVFARAATPLKTISLRVGKISFSVEVADTPLARMKGLSGHKPLLAYRGMLFIFNIPSQYSFWMKGMLFPLDFVWIHQGVVVGITEHARPMSETGYRLYAPPAPVTHVLEINAGAARRFGIRIGDAVW